MPLPLRYVDEIHARLMVRYGSAWAAKWAGFDATMMQAVKADWAEELSDMSPAAIRRALESLPAEFPPTATAFRKLGQDGPPRPELAAPALPAPKSPNLADKAAQVRAHFGLRRKPQELDA